MSVFELEKLLHTISTKPAWDTFCHDPESGLAGRDITSGERAALLNGDVRWLYENGLNEYLLLRYSGWIGLGGARLTAALQGATPGAPLQQSAEPFGKDR